MAVFAILYLYFKKDRFFVIKEFFSKHKQEIVFILFLYLVTRFFLAVLGVLFFGDIGSHTYSWNYSDYTILNIWGMWDSGWYLNIAENWYPDYADFNLDVLDQTSFNFFPLYPFLVKVAGFVLFKKYFIAGILVSNIFLLLSGFVLFKLVKMEYGTDTARRSLVYLFLMPASFILSSVFTESLFLFLIIFSIYNARNKNWFLACLFGLFLSLTKSLGVLVFFPLLIIYFKQIKFKLNRIRPNILYFFLIPVGTVIFSAINYIKTGDYLAFLHSQQISWGHKTSNPFIELINGVNSQFFEQNINSIFTIILIALFFIFYKKIKFEYWLYSMMIILIHLIAGGAMNSMFRYALIIFPIYIFLPLIIKNKIIERFLWVFLALVQCLFMVLWVNAYFIIV